MKKAQQMKLMELASEKARVRYEPYNAETLSLEIFNTGGAWARIQFNNYQPNWEGIRDLGQLLMNMADSHLEG